MAQLVKDPLAEKMWETWLPSLVCEDPLEKGKATHCSILAWRIPWTVQSIGSQTVGHDEQLSLSLFHIKLKIRLINLLNMMCCWSLYISL